jgi:hypothetical protein
MRTVRFNLTIAAEDAVLPAGSYEFSVYGARLTFPVFRPDSAPFCPKVAQISAQAVSHAWN